MHPSRSILSVLAIFAFAFIGCGSDGDSADDVLNSAGLTAEETSTVTNSLIDTMNSANSDYSGSNRLSTRGLTQSVPLNGQSSCPLSGRITYTGNVTVSADTNSSSIYGLITFQVSDPTNNLNDCEVADGVILDGTLTLTMSGNNTEGVGLSLTGTIGINERGQTGGLIPRGECFVLLNVAKGSSTATGSVCGTSI
jgi:hypothetical protein